MGNIAAGAGSHQDNERDRAHDRPRHDPGDSVKVRLDNTFGLGPVVFGRASIGPRVRGAALATGTIKALTFGGNGSVTVPAGASVESDPIPFHVDAQQDIAVSLLVAAADVQPSQHNNAVVTSYLTDNGAGDESASADSKAFTGKTTSMFWLKSIDVRPVTPAALIVAFGDSITDGTCSTLDAHDRWEDILALRLALQETGRWAVVNEGISGNTVTRANLTPAAASPPGVERLDRDVLSHAGVPHVVLFMGTNDIPREASAEQVMGGMKNVLSRVEGRGIKTIDVTIIPRHAAVPGVENTGWNDAKTKIRNEVNDWICKWAAFDAVIDFDKVLRSANDPNLIEPAYIIVVMGFIPRRSATSRWASRSISACSAPGAYASERLSHGESGKIAQGQSWSPTGLARYDRPG